MTNEEGRCGSSTCIHADVQDEFVLITADGDPDNSGVRATRAEYDAYVAKHEQAGYERARRDFAEALTPLLTLKPS